MTVQLSYASIPISIPRTEDVELINRYLYTENIQLFTNPEYWRGPNVQRLPLVVQPTPIMPALGVFFYPTHATRLAWFVGLASEKNKAAMENAAFGSGISTPSALPFVVVADDKTHQDNAGGITTNMYMLPSRPLGQTMGQYEGMYLITLVDERYYWQQFKNPGVWNQGELTTWQHLITLLATALGVTITNDAIAAAYLTPNPDSDLYTNYESAATLLDAVAWNIGMAPVRAYDGTYKLKRFRDADIAITGTSASNYTNRPNPPYRAFGGDIIDPTWGGVGLGPSAGQNPAYNTVLPQSVTVTFPAFQNGAYYDPLRSGFFVTDSYGFVYPVVVSLSSLGAPYSSFAGFSGTKVIEDTAKACFNPSQNPVTDNPANLGTLQALAQQLAMDYYDLHLNGVDELYAGIRNWVPDPVNDMVFYFREAKGVQEVMTRVLRKPWNFGISQAQHATSC